MITTIYIPLTTQSSKRDIFMRTADKLPIGISPSCNVHTLLRTVTTRIFTALDSVRLHKIHLPQSIQRWVFCKDIAQ